MSAKAIHYELYLSALRQKNQVVAIDQAKTDQVQVCYGQYDRKPRNKMIFD